MTVSAAETRDRGVVALVRGRRWLRHKPSPTTAPAEPGPVPAHRSAPVASAALLILAAVLLGLVGYLAGFGAVSHARTQQLAYDDLRAELANGTAPVGPTDLANRQLRDGAPVALLQGPGVDEVIREGTTSGVLAGGPGHRRDTVLPGQPGRSYVYGRRAAFGGPFAAVVHWRAGDRFAVVTGQGRQQYRVIGQRHAGDPYPPLMSGTSRLTLVTAAGPAFLPSGLLQVDADLVSPLQASPVRAPVLIRSADVALHGDTDALYPLALWTIALLVAACGLTWAAARWGGRQAWVVGVPVLLALGAAVASSATDLLPNLL